MSSLHIYAQDLSPPLTRYIALSGTTAIEESLKNLDVLASRLNEQSYEGVIMDYRSADPQLSMTDYKDLADRMGPLLKPDIRIAYLFNRVTLGRALFITRLLRESGVKTGAFGQWSEVQTFMRLASSEDPALMRGAA